MRKSNKTQSAETDVDMTPMLDIVFILLIFFIVTTSFIKENAINIHRPNQPTDPRPIDEPALLVTINELQEVQIANRLIQQDSVLANVQLALSNNPNLVVSVKTAESASTGILVRVVDQIKRAGIKKVTVSQLTD